MSDPHYVKCDQNNRPHPQQEDCRNPVETSTPERSPQYDKLRGLIRNRIEAWTPVHHRDEQALDQSTTDVLEAIWPDIQRRTLITQGNFELLKWYRDTLQEALRLLTPCVGRVDTTGFTDHDWEERANKILLHRDRPGDV